MSSSVIRIVHDLETARDRLYSALLKEEDDASLLRIARELQAAEEALTPLLELEEAEEKP